MTTNAYFNHLEHAGEQSLYDSITQESIQVSGFDVLYLQRAYYTDSILVEPRASSFDDEHSWKIEANIPQDLMGWQGQNQMMAAFGILVEQAGSILMSKTRWEAIMDERKLQQRSTLTRPMEGDLLYFGYGRNRFTNTLFQINKVDFSDVNWQMGRNFVYRLQCTLYTPTQDDKVEVAEYDLSAQLQELLDKQEGIAQNAATEDARTRLKPKKFNEQSPFGGF